MPISLGGELKNKAHNLAHHKLTCWIGNPCIISALLAIILTMIIILAYDTNRSAKSCVKTFLRVFFGIVVIVVVHNVFVKEQLKEKYMSEARESMMRDIRNPINYSDPGAQIQPRPVGQLPATIGFQQYAVAPVAQPMMAQPQPAMMAQPQPAMMAQPHPAMMQPQPAMMQPQPVVPTVTQPTTMESVPSLF